MAEEISATKHFLETLNTIEGEWGSWVDELNMIEQETQDLLHEIELTKFDVQRGYRLCKELRETRQRRRKLKEKMEILKTLKEFTESNKQLKISLYKALNTMQRTEEHQGQRMYTPRIRTDITLAERGGAG
ncbi:hypothetical protein [Desulfitobacterium hafniense]|uniref:hypothetical protein n=1 Tax=Desulfitobacterium hafniense TaxID=49338 RepID=UPI00030B7CB1|nr:hypothetical protein [Desulfitobacterium hafniense]